MGFRANPAAQTEPADDLRVCAVGLPQLLHHECYSLVDAIVAPSNDSERGITASGTASAGRHCKIGPLVSRNEIRRRKRLLKSLTPAAERQTMPVDADLSGILCIMDDLVEAASASAAFLFCLCGSLDLGQRSASRGAERACDAPPYPGISLTG